MEPKAQCADPSRRVDTSDSIAARGWRIALRFMHPTISRRNIPDIIELAPSDAANMLTKAKIKFVKSLADRKNRAAAGLFVAEGAKAVEDLLGSTLEIKELFAVKTWLDAAAATVPRARHCEEVSESDLARLSDLTTAHGVVAVVAIPDIRYTAADLDRQLVVGLESLQDPGNLGAIIRLCDWFGIAHIIASRTTVDCFNAKVVQATMGSIARVHVHYRHDFVETIDELKSRGKSVYATSPAGADLYGAKLATDAVILFGNEGSGLRQELMSIGTQRLCIPRHNAISESIESLNVAVAAGIVVSEFRRRGK
jgi:TrmH family RNA methyltransferase